MTIIDLAQPVTHDGFNCPAHPPVRIDRIADHPTDGWRMERLTLASHTGSHLDAPLHKIAGGASIDQLPLATFVGPAVIADFRGIAPRTPIDDRMLAGALPDLAPDRIVMLATGWGDRRAKSTEWLTEAPFLSPEGARWMVERGTRAVAIDHYSIGGCAEPGNARTHEILLGAGLWVLEDIAFPEALFALPQPFTLWALPVHFPGFSGSFCRPVAVAP